jgi:hypothetical protein
MKFTFELIVPENTITGISNILHSSLQKTVFLKKETTKEKMSTILKTCFSKGTSKKYVYFWQAVAI